MGETQAQILFGAVLPVIIGVVCGLPWARAKRDEPEGGSDPYSWLLPLGLAAAVIGAFLGLYGWPDEQWKHVAFVPAAGVVVAALMDITRRTWWMRGVLMLILSGLVCGAIWAVIEREVIGYTVAVAVGTFVSMIALEAVAVRRPGPSFSLGLFLAAGATTALVLLSGSFTLAIPVGSMTAVLGVLTALNFWKPERTLADGALAVVVPVLVVVPVVRWLYVHSEGGLVPPICFIMVGAAPLLLCVLAIPKLRKGAWIAIPIVIVLVGGVGVVANIMADNAVESPESDDPDEEMYRDMMNE